jgi:hypothetical protein
VGTIEGKKMTGSKLQSTLDRLDELKRKYEALSALGDKIEELKEEINKCQPYLTDKAKVNLRNLVGKAETTMKGPIKSVELIDAASDGNDKVKTRAVPASELRDMLGEILNQNVEPNWVDEFDGPWVRLKPDRGLVPKDTLDRMLLLIFAWDWQPSEFKGVAENEERELRGTCRECGRGWRRMSRMDHARFVTAEDVCVKCRERQCQACLSVGAEANSPTYLESIDLQLCAGCLSKLVAEIDGYKEANEK